MEEPLITEESSSRNSGGSGQQRPPKPYQKRYDAIAYGTRYQKASALVDLAEDGIGLPEEVLNDPRFERAAKFYFMYIQFDWLWSLNLFALVVLNFLEKPLWCAKPGRYSCQDRDYFFLGELPYLTKAESLIYEGITLLILILHTFFPLAYEGFHLYWKNNLNKLKVLLVLFLMCDMLVYALYVSPLVVAYLPIRFSPYIRVAFVALTIRELRTCIVTLAGMIGMYLNVLALWLLFLLFASWLAYVTFEDTQQGKIMFYSYGATLYQMFVLFTTSNNPDVWIPAYKSSRWSCLFFVVYVLLGVYFLTNLILAVVYDSFKAQLAKQVGEMDAMRISILGKAFSLIDNHKQGFLNKEQCIRLFEELNKYRSLPKTSREDFELIFAELDHSGDFKINLEEFTDLCNAIALRFQKEPSPSCFERFPTFYHSPPCEKLKAFVRSPTFGYIIAFVLVLNFVAVVIETTLDIENSSGQKVWQAVEFCFGWIYVLEMALKIFSFGFDAYWMEGQNRFDFVVTWIIVIGEATTFFFSSELPFLSNGEWIRYLLIARMLRLIRLLLHVKRYRAFVATFLTLIPSLMPYLGIIFCVLCIYCSLGLQLFGGIVNSGNPRLKATEMFDDDYILFNFNDYPNGMVTLFNLLVMGNWQVWMQSYRDLTGTFWTLAYFISFYLITVLLLLNLGALGAIDGSHIPAIVKKKKHNRYRNRKNFISQNVMAACSFDHTFLYVAAGWEGSASDMSVLRAALEEGKFNVPEGKFYLVDSGYANTPKFIAPYRGSRYHISDFAHRSNTRTYRDAKDKFNHRHAQLRNAVEKAWGILKQRFKILKVAAPFPYKTQVKIVVACCVLHNFIARHKGDDKYFNMLNGMEMPEEVDEEEEDPQEMIGSNESLRGCSFCVGSFLCRNGTGKTQWT